MNNLLKYKLCSEVSATATGKLLYLVLNDLANNGGEVTIPQRRISDALRISRSAVRRNLRRLERNGAISIFAQYHSDGGRAANKYIVR